jgi:hypothetical protein
MPDHEEKLCGDSARQITFNAKPAVLALLLELIQQRRIASRPTWPEIESVITLGERFQFVHVPSLVVCHLTAYSADGDSWGTFVLASKLRLREIGRHAIRYMHRSAIEGCLADSIPASLLKEVAGDWALALANVMKDCTFTAYGQFSRVDWEAASKAFRVVDEW